MTIEEAERYLGIKILDRFRNNNFSFEQAKKLLDNIKKDVQKIFREKAKKLHPDICGKPHEEMSLLIEARDCLLRLCIERKNVTVRPPIVRICVHKTPLRGFFGNARPPIVQICIHKTPLRDFFDTATSDYYYV